MNFWKNLRQGSQKIYFFISNLASKKSKLKIVQPLHPSCSSSRQGLLVSRGIEEVEKEHQLRLRRRRPDLNLEMTTLVILTGLSWSLNCWTKDVYYHQKASREVKRQLYKKKDTHNSRWVDLVGTPSLVWAFIVCRLTSGDEIL